MKIFGRGKKEETPAIRFGKETSLTEQNRVAPDYVDEFGRFQAMLKDEQMTYLLWTNMLFRKTVPARSHLNRTANYDKQDKKLQLLQYQGLNILTMMQMDEEDYENGGAIFVESLDIYDYNMVCDNLKGWKARVTTEVVKRLETTVEEAKKKGWRK